MVPVLSRKVSLFRSLRNLSCRCVNHRNLANFFPHSNLILISQYNVRILQHLCMHKTPSNQSSALNYICIIALFFFQSSYMVHCTIFNFLAREDIVTVLVKLWLSWDELRTNSGPWEQQLASGLQGSSYAWLEVAWRCHGGRRVWWLQAMGAWVAR